MHVLQLMNKLKTPRLRVQKSPNLSWLKVLMVVLSSTLTQMHVNLSSRELKPLNVWGPIKLAKDKYCMHLETSNPWIVSCCVYCIPRDGYRLYTSKLSKAYTLVKKKAILIKCVMHFTWSLYKYSVPLFTCTFILLLSYFHPT